MYRFPKDQTEKGKWIKAIPNANLRVSKDTVVCALHWPSGFEGIEWKILTKRPVLDLAQYII